MTPEQRPNIFDYDDYLLFLQNLYEFKKKNENASYKSIGIKCGLSESHIHKLFTGSRKLTPDICKNFTKSLNFSLPEEVYFTLLTQHESTPSVQILDERIDRYMRLVEMLVLETTILETFRPDPEWISLALNNCISLDDARTALLNLMKSGRITSDDTSWKKGDKTILSKAGDEEHDQNEIRLSLAAKIISSSPMSRTLFGVTSITQEQALNIYKELVKTSISLETEARNASKQTPTENNIYALTLAVSQVSVPVEQKSYL